MSESAQGEVISQGHVRLEELLAPLSPPRDLLGDSLRSLVLRSEKRVLALDDDPTGTQTVHDVPLVLNWSEDDMIWALRQPSPLSVIVTNSRSLTSQMAYEIVVNVASSAATAAGRLGVEVSFMSRGDSTLRGHFPLETDVLMNIWEETYQTGIDAVLFCPAYVEAGRITVNGTHYVVNNEVATPVGQTEFARDATFGYRSSRLIDWTDEKVPGRFDLSRAQTIDLDDIRLGGVDQIFVDLMALEGGQLVVIDAAVPSDLDIFAAAVIRAESMGKHFVVQCGPSFLRARAGLPPRGALSPGEIFPEGSANNPYGLVVVGSHVGLTNEQLEVARDLGGFVEIELDVTKLLDQERSRTEITRAVHAAVASLKESDAILVTSRSVVTGVSADQSLKISGTISAALVSAVREIVKTGPPLRYLLTKGGITSCDILRESLGFSRGWVVGQILDGMVSVWAPASAQELTWQLNDSKSCPLVVFAGNVGGSGGLAEVVRALRKNS